MSVASLVRHLLVALGGVHFALAAVYVLPNNPIKTGPIGDAARRYIGGYFQQNWSFFAPNPVSDSTSVLVQCFNRSPDDHGEIPAPPKSTDWEDMTTPLVAAAQRNRLSGYEHLVRPQEKLVRDFVSGGPDAAALRNLCKLGANDRCQDAERELKRARVHLGFRIGHLASLYCTDRYGSRYTAVAVRLRVSEPVPWSDRYAAEPKFTDSVVGIFPIKPPISPTQLFASEDSGGQR